MICVSRLNKLIVWQYIFWRVTSTSKRSTFSFDQSAINLIVGWNELILLINSFNNSSPCSQIKNISPIYLHQTLGFFLTSLKIFSSKGFIISIAYGRANFVPIVVPRICLSVLSENSKMLFFNASVASWHLIYYFFSLVKFCDHT